MKKDKLSVFNAGFIDIFFTMNWQNMCHRYVTMPNVSIYLV